MYHGVTNNHALHFLHSWCQVLSTATPAQQIAGAKSFNQRQEPKVMDAVKALLPSDVAARQIVWKNFWQKEGVAQTAMVIGTRPGHIVFFEDLMPRHFNVVEAPANLPRQIIPWGHHDHQYFSLPALETYVDESFGLPSPQDHPLPHVPEVVIPFGENEASYQISGMSSDLAHLIFLMGRGVGYFLGNPVLSEGYPNTLSLQLILPSQHPSTLPRNVVHDPNQETMPQIAVAPTHAGEDRAVTRVIMGNRRRHCVVSRCPEFIRLGELNELYVGNPAHIKNDPVLIIKDDGIAAPIFVRRQYEGVFTIEVLSDEAPVLVVDEKSNRHFFAQQSAGAMPVMAGSKIHLSRTSIFILE